MDLKEIMQKRYATKKFTGEKIPEEKFSELKEMIKLAPSSFGLQPYKVKVISDQETKEKLAPAAWNQAQITTCSHLLIFCAYSNIKERIEQMETMLIERGVPEEKAKAHTSTMKGFEEGMSLDKKITWSQRQLYLAAENALLGSKELGFDSCPMEGFQPEEFSKILELPSDIVPTMLVAVGHAADEPRPKTRYSEDQLFF